MAKAYGAPISARAAAGGEDDIIILTASAPTGKEAARRANAYAETYQSARLDAILADLTTAKKVVTQQIADFQKQVNDLNEPLEKLDEQKQITDRIDTASAALAAEAARLAKLRQQKQGLMQALLTPPGGG